MLWIWLTAFLGGVIASIVAGSRQRQGRLIFPNAVIFAAVIVVIVLSWLAREDGQWTGGFSFVGRQQDYYNLLVEGFMHGHLYLPVTPDPGLFSPDPLTRRLAPYLLDAGLYKGHYYLYYGVVPAALLLLPYRLITGANLSLNLVTLSCCLTGFAWALATFESARQRYFPRLGKISLGLLVLLLGLGAGTTFLVRRSMFYEVPAAAGYACAMAAAFFLFRAMVEAKRSMLSLGWASAWLGLAVGCRPNYIFAIPALATAACWCGRHSLMSGDQPQGKRIRGLFCAALAPMAVVGAALAAYNRIRFGSIFDFGFSHGMNSFFQSDQSLFSVARMPWNALWYYFSAPALSPYFPFVYPINGSFGPEGDGGEAMHGEAAFVPLIALLLLGGWLTRNVHGRIPWAWVAAMAWLILPSFVFMLLLKIRADRYLVDFHAPALVVAVMGIGTVLSAAAQLRPIATWAIRGAFGASATLIIGFNILAALQQFDGFRYTDPDTYAYLTRLSSHPASWIRDTLGLSPGPVELQIVFNAPPFQPRFEPILTTGLPLYSDTVYALRYPDNRVELTVDHHGYGRQHGQVFTVVPGRTYTVRVDMGSLYPPAEDPYFAKWDPAQIDLAKTTAKITLDGAIALNSRMRFYEAPPWSLTPGKNDTTYTGFARAFGGKILSFRRLGSGSASILNPKSRSSGYWNLNLQFDRGSPGVTEPLLASGLTGSGNLVFVEVLADGHVRFGCDFWGFYAVRSKPLSFALETPHHVELFAGPLVASWPWPAQWNIDPDSLEAQRRSFRVWVDGQLAWSLPLDRHLDSYDITELGTNTAGFGTAIDIYSAPLKQLESTPEQSRAFILKNLALAPANTPAGPGHE